MSILKRYADILEQLIDVKSDLTFYEEEVKVSATQLEDLEESISQLENTELASNSPIIKKLIAEEAAKINANYQQQVADLVAQKNRLKVKDNEKRVDAINRASSLVTGHDILKLTYTIIKESEDVISTNNFEDIDTPIENFKILKKRTVLFAKHLEYYETKCEPFCFKVSKILSLQNIFENLENPKVAVGLMTGYLCVLAIGALYLSPLALLAYGVMTGLSIRDALKMASDKDAIEEEFALLKKSYESNEKVYNDSYRLEIDQINNKLDMEYRDALSDINEDEDTLLKEFNTLLDEVKIMETDPNYANKHLGIYKSKLNSLLAEKTDYEETLLDAKDTLDAMRLNLETLTAEKEDLKQKILSEYLGNLTPGTDRLLQDTLYLGFNSSEELVTFDYNQEASLLLYSGKVSDTVDIALLIFTQLLCNTNPSALNIHLFDTDMGAQRFAPFTQKELSDVVFIHATKEQSSKALKDLHTILQIRNQEILMDASSIEDYNKNMLSKNSLTKEYIILIIMESGGAIFGNNQFQQLCKSGPAVGIIPIVFLHYQSLLACIQGTNTDEKKNYLELLTSIPSNYYLHVKEQSSLSKYDDSFRESLLIQLQ